VIEASPVFAPEERTRVRERVLALARADARISGGALTGSAVVGAEDRWSDIDFSFGVVDDADPAAVLGDLTRLLEGELDVAVTAAAEFGARGPNFRLLFGESVEHPPAAPTPLDELIGLGWLCALDARNAIERGKLWQAEYRISGLRDQALALACLRFGEPTAYARGVDRLPREVLAPYEQSLVRSLDPTNSAGHSRAAASCSSPKSPRLSRSSRRGCGSRWGPSTKAEPDMGSRPLQTSITLVLEHVDPELSRAHRELYPERIPEHIPFSLTLHYPWLPAEEVTNADLQQLRSFFAERQTLEFQLTRVTQFPGLVAYAVPEPDEELRATMRALWAMYPQCPPYGRPGFVPPPHATLTRYANPENATFEQAKERVEPLLPVRCVVTEATLQEEYELDRMGVRATFPLSG
jgi:hypothetical protein